MKKVLVTGGAGYIGSNAIKPLLDSGYKVVVIDCGIKGYKEIKDSNVVWYKVSLKNLNALKKIFSEHNFFAVIHFAALTIVSESVRNPVKYFDGNYEVTKNLLILMQEFKINKFIFSSTGATYGEISDDSAVCSEDEAQKPINSYGSSKLCCELFIKSFAKVANMNFAILRYFNVAGSDNHKFCTASPSKTLLIPSIIEAVSKQSQFLIYGKKYNTPDGTCIRDYIDVRDLINAHISALKYLSSKKQNLIINVGSGRGYSVKEVVEIAMSHWPELKIKYVSARSGDNSKIIADITKIKKLLNWTPIYDIDDMLVSEFNQRKCRK